MKYTEFVKANYSKVAHLPHKERFKHLAKMWAEHKANNTKGGGFLGDIAHKAGDIAGIFGLGLDMPKKRGRKPKGGALSSGSAGALPKKRGHKVKGGVMSAGSLNDTHGAGFLSGVLGSLGL
jgi:hypothetical protein